MKQVLFTVSSHRQLSDSVWELRLSGDTSAISGPGQFVNIKIEGFYLRRPISVCDWDENSLTLLYKVVGSGTAALSRLPVGAQLDVLCGLGNGYDMSKSGNAPLLVGGGVGIPPLYALARLLIAQGKQVQVILGFNTAAEQFYVEEFRALGAEVTVCTADGSAGIKGLVTAAMPQAAHSYVYSCGPLPMLQAVAEATPGSGQFSFEERMGCGFGACMGCSCQTKYGNKRICKEGPVLEKEEIIW